MSAATMTLSRVFHISSMPSAILAVASQPLLGPQYLNFLTRIEPLTRTATPGIWSPYQVWVQYRAILKTQGRVDHYVDAVNQRVSLRHNGPLVAFEAAFDISNCDVRLHCTYRAKVPFASWIIAKVLDRTLEQVASAMDRYAATGTWDPQ
jgi:hypothetical protein